MDIADSGLANGNGIRQAVQGASQQGDISAFNGDIRPCSDGKTHIGLAEGGSVINAIAGHAHNFPFCLQA